MADTCSSRLVGSWPIGRMSLQQLSDYDSAGLPPWFQDFLNWLQRWQQDLLDNLVTFSDLHGNEGDAFRIPVSRTCPPDFGDLSADYDWQTADFDFIQYHVCYCEDQDELTHLRLLGLTLSTVAVEDLPANPGTYLYFPYVYATKQPILMWYDPNTGEYLDCCAVPQQCFYTDGNLEALWGLRTMTVLALSPLATVYPGITSRTEWTGAGDVWGNSPTLSANLNSLGTVLAVTYNAVETLCEAFFYYLYSMNACWDFNNPPKLSVYADCDEGGGPG